MGCDNRSFALAANARDSPLLARTETVATTSVLKAALDQAQQRIRAPADADEDPYSDFREMTTTTPQYQIRVDDSERGRHCHRMGGG